jgi:hypothetical protein
MTADGPGAGRFARFSRRNIKHEKFLCYAYGHRMLMVLSHGVTVFSDFRDPNKINMPRAVKGT